MEEMRDETFSPGLVPRDASSSRDGDRDAIDEQEEVRRRAYERYLARGDGPGNEQDDWLEAERDVRSAREAPVRVRRKTKDR